jgi:hypothetical protein
MNTSTVLYNTRISWQLITTKSSATDIKLLEPISADASDYVAEYQPYEIAPQEILGNFLIQTEDRIKMWADFESLYGAWADRDDMGEDWLDNLRAGWNVRLADIYDADGE